MNQKIINQRRHQRHEISLPATLQAGGVVVPCRVHNISASGVLIEVSAHLRIGDRAAVKIPDFGSMVGRVAHVSSTAVGIAFEEGEEAMDSFIMAWRAHESGKTEWSETAPADERDCQAV
jgi:hypothetical protein